MQIVWTQDGQAAALLLDGVPCATADFARERYMSRSPLKPSQEWEQAAFDARFGGS